MKHILFLGLAMTALSLFAVAQDEKQPKIEFERMEHDFGKIEKGSKVDTEFKFKNTGDATLEIKDVSTSCGCTSAKPEKTTYAPGEEGVIPVSFNSGRFSGPIQKNVTIVTNDTTNPRTIVKIKAEIIVDIMVKPPSIFVNNLKRGETATQELLVSTERIEKLEITDIKADQPFMMTSMERIDDKNVKINITVDGAKVPSGESRLRGFVSFNTNSESQPTVKTNVNVLIENPVSAQPNSVYMFGSKEGQPREAMIRLQPTAENKLVVNKEDVSIDVFLTQPDKPTEKTPVDIFTAEVTNEEGGATLKITLSEKAQKGRFEGAIIVKTNVQEQPEVRIPLRGSVI
ncbi:MAG: DUF1573 domain-containing protein [Acidobacteria bacterium]|nr:DUF1573 domain-containing protein [Acidobacteriota bacterium]